uniref:Uncharacterized protein n=1 Tax=Meloidogyne enterolobii TaxID=390850 RepID=A0A6V7US80_MELEN|nr:unnamed protein product [Meloidogyne enterolobii]
MSSTTKIFILLIFTSIFLQIQTLLTILNKESPSSCNPNKNLIFSSCKDSLPWPREDFTSISVLITHGIHCIDILQEDNPNFEEHLQFHKEHCLELIKLIYKFFEENKNYTVQKELCKDFRQAAFPGGRVRRGLWGCGWENGKEVGGRRKRGCSGRRKKRDLEEVNGLEELDDNDFKEMATRNFEKLLLKEKKEKLSEIEKKYLEGSRNPLAIRMAAVGIYCKFESYENVVKDVINGKIIFN